MSARLFPLDNIDSVYINTSRDKFLEPSANRCEIPVNPHPGAFGVIRKNHTHEGVDIYCPEGTIVQACEDGIFMGYHPFTGPQIGMPWWNDTWCAIVKHKEFVLVYGEIVPMSSHVNVGYPINAGNIMGVVVPVLIKNKGRPMSMLHLEMYDKECNPMDITHPWELHGSRPKYLMNPTDYLTNICFRNKIFKGIIYP